MAATMAAQSLLSIPVEYRSQVWCRANLPYPPAPQLPIPAVVDILTKASQALPQVVFRRLQYMFFLTNFRFHFLGLS